MDRMILHEGVVKRGGEFRGSGHTSLVLEQHELEMIVKHVKHMENKGMVLHGTPSGSFYKKFSSL